MDFKTGFILLASLAVPVLTIAQESLLFTSATELARKIRTGEITSVEVVNAYLFQIEKHNAVYNAVVTVNREGALSQALLADQAVKRGERLGKLHGVPVTIKDNYLTQDITTTSAYLPLRTHIPKEDAELVKLLKAEGAIIIGKTNLSVLAMDMQADNPIFGKTNNAWNTNRTSGGSSGGCAVALATGMTPLSIGNDLAGSIRIPSAYCGVYGFKPTFGTVSLKGIQANPKEPVNGLKSLAVAGPLARSPEDLLLALDILAKSTISDRKLIPLERSEEKVNLNQLRIAWSDGFGGVPVDDEIKAAIQSFVAELEKSGIVVQKINPPIDFEAAWKTWGSFVGMQGGYNTSNFVKRLGLPFTKGMLRDVPMHQNIVKPNSVKTYMQALNEQEKLIAEMENFLSGYDAFICPVSSVVAFPHHRPSKKIGTFSVYNEPLLVNGAKLHYYRATQSYTIPFSVTENPVLTMPISFTKDSMPIGVQVVGKRFSDFHLIQIGIALSEKTERMDYPLSRI